MTHLEWQKLAEMVAHMTPDEKARLLTLVNSSLADDTTPGKDPLFGLFADDPALVETVVEAAYATREQHPLRLPNDG